MNIAMQCFAGNKSDSTSQCIYKQILRTQINVKCFGALWLQHKIRLQPYWAHFKDNIEDVDFNGHSNSYLKDNKDTGFNGHFNSYLKDNNCLGFN